MNPDANPTRPTTDPPLPGLDPVCGDGSPILNPGEPGQAAPGAASMDVLVDGQIRPAVPLPQVKHWVRTGRLNWDDMVREEGGSWVRVTECPGLVAIQAAREVRVETNRNRVFSDGKVLAAAVPPTLLVSAVATLFDLRLRDWGDYLSTLPFVVAMYLVLFAGSALLGNRAHIWLIRRGFGRGFWRYGHVPVFGVGLGVILKVTGTPPYIPFFSLSPFLSATVLFLTIVLLFRVMYEP